jgi:membrane-bound ClpP family serine protease
LNTLWSGISEAIGESRQLDESQLDKVVSTAISRDPEKALAEGIIDGISYKDEYDEALKQAIKTDLNPVSAESKLNQINVSAYSRTWGLTRQKPKTE